MKADLKTATPRNSSASLSKTAAQPGAQYWCGHTKHICSPGGSNCLKEVTIKAHRYAEVMELVSLAGSGPANSSSVKSFFNAAVHDGLFPSLTPDLTDKLRSGNYGVLAYENSDSAYVFIAGPTATLNGDNIDFAWQVKIED